MHIGHRLRSLAILGLLLMPLALGEWYLASLLDKHQAAEQLDAALDVASTTYRSGRGLYAVKRQREEELQAQDEQLLEVTRRKRDVRLQRAALHDRMAELHNRYGIDVHNTGAVLVLAAEEEAKFAGFVRYLHERSYHAAGPDLGLTVLRQMLHASLGDITAAGIRDRALKRARRRAFMVVMEAKTALHSAADLQGQHEVLLQEYAGKWGEYTATQDKVRAADARIAQVRRVTEEVHAQVLRLQAELARIDAQLRARLERELIEKGLMEARPGERSSGEVRSTQSFMWPAIGRISAGFHSHSYEQFFGVPHRGIDIVVSQGSPVFAADDGIVFLARDGGRHGYSYVLVGHRNGYATLYGHLSRISVSNGQELRKGQVLGLSGGTPGTYGAGPMTTGAHLHFEVIRNGSHLDPLLVLP